MALATYSDLQSSITSWLGRPGDTVIPTSDIITLVESDANRRFRTHYQEAKTTISTVSGTETYALPTDFIEHRELYNTTSNAGVVYVSPPELDDTWAGATHASPVNFTIEGTNLRVAPIPDAVYSLRFEYLARVPALSNSNTTNWLLTNFPDFYLFSCLAEAELFLGADSSDDRYQMFLQRREAAYQAINEADRKAKRGGPTSLNSYTNLQASILAWLGRDNDPVFPTGNFISIVEAEASRRLRTHFQETIYTFSTVAGTASYALPTGFLAARELSITSTNPIVVIDYLAPGQLDDTWILTTEQQPFNYTLEGSNLRLGPTPDAVYTMRLEYWAGIPALSNASPTNWLLTNYPDLYLFGALCEASLFLGTDTQDERYQMFLQRRETAYQQILVADRKYRTGGASLQMKLDVGGP